jgi:CHAT domain-containing protein
MKKRVWLISFALGLAFAGLSSFQDPKDIKRAEDFFAVGQRLYANGKYKQASDTLARSSALFEQLKRPIDRVRSANLQAECLSNLGQCDRAGALLQTSLASITSQPVDNRAVLADTYYYLSRHAGGCARKFDDAIGLMRKSLEIKTGLYPAGDPSFAFDYTFLGYIYNSKGRYDSALIYLDQAMSIRTKHLKGDDIETSHTLFNLAASYEGKSQLGKALDINLRALRIRSASLGPSHATVANSINSIGRVYRKLGNQERALDYYQQALEIRKNTLGATHPNVAGSYYEIGNLYGNISNYHAAIEYIQQGNRILENNSQVFNDVLPTYLAYAGKLYGLVGENDNAKAYIQKAVAVVEKKLPASHPYRAVVYNIAGEYYGEVGDVKNQSEFFKKAIVIYQSSYGATSEREADVLAKMASIYAKLGRTTDALKLYGDALTMYLNKLGSQNPKTAAVYLGIGDVHARSGNFSEAEKSYGLASESVGNDNKPQALKIARSKAQMFQRNSGTRSLSEYRLALQLSDEIAQGYNNDAARIQLEKERRELYDGAMNVAWDLYNTTHTDSILHEAFTMAEKSKVVLLLENTRDQQAKTMAGVPDSLVDNERDIRIELAYYKTNLYQAEKNKDTAAARAFEKNVFDTERKLEQFKSQLERSFPAYFKLKYSRSSVDLADTQRLLPENTTLLQYFVGDHAIYSFQISRGEAQFKRQAFDDEFKNTVAGYQKSLTDFKFIVNEPAAADSLYLSTSRSLFSRLMIPTVSGNGSQRLIIVPDDFLAQFNFGTLLCEDTKESNYATLPYLNSRYTISYAYSAAFLDDAIRGNKKPHDNFAGFAPSYEQVDYTGIDSALHPMAALVVRSGNLPLPGATEEVNLISKLMQGESWLNEEATETNFKKYGGDYDVLHLAMHSLLNDEEPRYSELLFNHRKDGENDGYLTIAEIYNLKLNAQLVVLSACSSGFGKIQHGEGPISLSRAFSYAGCPSVVMSLWKVPDLITTKIMKNFYESLTEGMSKDEALQAAQAKFIRENTDPLYRHPYYWAGFVVIGDTSPLEAGTSYVGYVIGGIVLVVGLVIVWRRKKR